MATSNGTDGKGAAIRFGTRQNYWRVAMNIAVLTSDQLIELALITSPTSGFCRVEVQYP